jgi:hypothetical protein
MLEAYRSLTQQNQKPPDHDRRCIQCNRPPDGKEYLLPVGHGDVLALLHKECWQFYDPNAY